MGSWQRRTAVAYDQDPVPPGHITNQWLWTSSRGCGGHRYVRHDGGRVVRRGEAMAVEAKNVRNFESGSDRWQNPTGPMVPHAQS